VLVRHADSIAASYGLGAVADLCGPAARGEQGEVWRLETSARTWAVKLLYEEPNPDDARADGIYQEEVLRAGVPMPALRRTIDGEINLALEGLWVRVYEWVDIDEPDPGLDPARVGELVARIHAVRCVSAARPVDPWYADAVGAERWDEIVESLSAGAAPFAAELAGLRDELVALEGLLSAPRDLQVCHRDLWADNVRGTPGGALCVIDWENAGLADPSQELCIALFEFGLGDDARTRELFESYRGHGGPGRVRDARDFSMLIAQLGHITEWACIRWLKAGASESERARAEARVGECTSRPLTREAIAQMLGAVGAV
jgi:Ser/Thr protein kinase RdoA (MazF antagonist)